MPFGLEAMGRPLSLLARHLPRGGEYAKVIVSKFIITQKSGKRTLRV